MKASSIIGATATFIAAAEGAGNTGNPLATSDQAYLDALAININNAYGFPVLKAEAKAAYRLAHGSVISDEASSTLDAAIDELAFSAIQKAVNTDVYHPKVYWVDAGPRSWFGLDVPGGRYSYDNPGRSLEPLLINSLTDWLTMAQTVFTAPSPSTAASVTWSRASVTLQDPQTSPSPSSVTQTLRPLCHTWGAAI